jgi:hypothetical protein
VADCAFYVEDAVGGTFLYTLAADTYERSFREHANWWKGYMRSPGQRLCPDGKPARKPLFPVRIVVERLDNLPERIAA